MLKTPMVAASAFVAPNVTLWGDITIEDDVVLLPGVVMRAEVSSIRVAAGSNVQDNAVFHVDEGTPIDVGERVTIGHGAVLHGCTVGHDSLIGIGAIVLNRAVIGEHSMVAAGALVPEGYALFPGETEIEPLDPKLSAKSLSFQAKITAQVVPEVDTERIKDELTGRNVESAQQYLSSLGEITSYELKLWPNLPPALQRIPRSPKRITINLVTE